MLLCKSFYVINFFTTCPSPPPSSQKSGLTGCVPGIFMAAALNSQVSQSGLRLTV